MSNKPGFFRQLKDTQNYSTKFLIVLFSPNSGVTPSWQLKGLSDAQIKKIGVYKQEFIDANTSKISPNDRRGYDEIFESWEPLLKDPNQVKNFKIVQDLLERKRQN